jgi:cobalamin synthase
MISKYRNRALIQIVIAITLTILLVLVFRMANRFRPSSDDWFVLALILYVAAYAFWVMGSLSMAKARGYNGDSIGFLFMVCFIVGFCIPILPLLFPFFIIFGLEDKTKNRTRRG